MRTFWGDNDNDLATDKATPHLIRMLALCQSVLDECDDITDAKLAVALNLIDVEERLMDVIATIREYQKDREKECKESEADNGGH